MALPCCTSQVEARYDAVRAASVAFAQDLSDADATVQSMPDASPIKWHLAHTTWFFETFLLSESGALSGSRYRPYDPRFAYLFNSYYEAAGPRHPRPQRGLLSRPTLDDVLRYRRHVDAAMHERLLHADLPPDVHALITLGLHHEEQHQELMQTDLLHLFAQNPLRPAHRQPACADDIAGPLQWIAHDGGQHRVGHEGESSGPFAFDCETPAHDILLRPFAIASRVVTNGEWRAFIEDGGYRTAGLWLSDGWATVQREGWGHPLYWELHDGEWQSMTLAGMQPIDDDAPVRHVSYFEADAFARWAGKRLPTEHEWEVAATVSPDSQPAMAQRFGPVWQWTASPYVAYPGFRPAAGAVGEYNGKFMCGQFVLRGGSLATPPGHARATYRNFFYPHQRWQFCGLRLAEDR
ncbi:ergothioneine biosynthesis protein EgtB [Pandoraea cepalis]|uniref:Ergothioneine biosynthesis protein EgtB n=1 Tax=Pandoraea cepalis TaxID=2508294 RepID=A0AAW7MQU0_9BURK|nr:ergothioneine biosynthesis protein EgtB [Pandoraea cepalis]MDN4575146.1 ergothioneine biosynthesis protein EgtB [Pandoraea cepalis]MDN4579216.1 ergothioneine biosynthesis protein EgtB [Pandoraea cepalis]